ncbi:hypothetical protein ENSA7_75330 [Enhygromyxa salina]|uniref:Lipoprotein n=2 Tax=Enhygromyxa salina TaxID=215803 RepID=A0A2S9XQS6_9BACT|nr:hypothetical protein ENSA7_75330 [Enhygromyxa salina]
MAAVRRSLRHRASKLSNTANGVLSLVLLASCTRSTPTDSNPVIYRRLGFHTPGNGQGIDSRGLVKILDAHDIECSSLEGSNWGEGAEQGSGSCRGTEREWRQAAPDLAPYLASGHLTMIISREMSFYRVQERGVDSQELAEILEAADIVCFEYHEEKWKFGVVSGWTTCQGTEQEWRQAEVDLAPLLASGHVKLTTDALIEPTPAPASRQSDTQ